MGCQMIKIGSRTATSRVTRGMPVSIACGHFPIHNREYGRNTKPRIHHRGNPLLGATSHCLQPGAGCNCRDSFLHERLLQETDLARWTSRACTPLCSGQRCLLCCLRGRHLCSNVGISRAVERCAVAAVCGWNRLRRDTDSLLVYGPLRRAIDVYGCSPSGSCSKSCEQPWQKYRPPASSKRMFGRSNGVSESGMRTTFWLEPQVGHVGVP